MTTSVINAPRALTWIAAAAAAITCGSFRAAQAADTEVSLTLEPLRQAFVSGDAEKFRAHHWMHEGYAGGVKAFSGRTTLPDGTDIAADGHALMDQHDVGAALSVKRAALGFFDMDYSVFRKYYDGSAGVFRRFTQFQTNETDRELALDIGKLDLTSGLQLEGWPELTALYEREFKRGAKSRLSWAGVKEASDTRKIGPVWQEIDEVVDSFAVKAAHELAGIMLNGEQRWERARSESLREERQLSNTTAAADAKIRRQDQAPQADVMTTTLGGERRFLNDKIFAATSYHFAHMKNREFETISEYNAAGVLTNFTNPEQKPNNRADTDYDTHTWVGHLSTGPWKSLTVGTKLKAEVTKRHSYSTYNKDFLASGGSVSAPNGIIDGTDLSLNDTKATRWGEALSFRFTGVPRTALYTELELEQGRVLLREDRKSIDGPDAGNGADANEVFNRETVALIRRGTWTLGGQAAPWSFLNLTVQVKRRVNNNDYDDQRETDPGAGTARSAFIDAQDVHTDEFVTRLTYHPCRWFRSSLRYQLRNDKYATRVEAQDTVKTGMVSNIYTYDVTVQPLRKLMTTASFSRQTALTRTPARFSSSDANTPAFHADVNTWLLGADYTPTPALTFTSSLLCSGAGNFNDFADTGLPLGADFHRVDLTTGVTWAVNERTSLGADYAFYRYNPNENVESGDYTAHVVWLEVSQKF